MNIEEIRKDTPGCQDKLFVNSAGASLMPGVVLNTMVQYLKEEADLGGYFLADKRHEEIRLFYNRAAQLLHGHARNIAFCHDATDAYSKALSSITFQQGDVIITTDDDYVSNHLSFISLQKRYGIKILKGRNLSNGDLDLTHFNELISKYNPKLVSVTHIPTNSGLIQDVTAIGSMCREQDCMYLVDACQSVGQINVNTQEIQCDFLSATGRKFMRGPRGTGLLFVSDRILERQRHPVLVDLYGATWIDEFDFRLRKDAGRFEYWEKPYALQVGLSEAIKYMLDIGIDPIAAANRQLMAKLRINLSDINGIRTFDKGSEKASILTFRKTGVSKERITKVFDEKRVFYSIAGIHNALLDFRKKDIEWAVRISPHYFNTPEEMDELADIMDQL